MVLRSLPLPSRAGWRFSPLTAFSWECTGKASRHAQQIVAFDHHVAEIDLIQRRRQPQSAPAEQHLAPAHAPARGGACAISLTTARTLHPGQFTFSRDALMLFIRTLDAIFELTAIVRELPGHLVNPAGHIATDCGPDPQKNGLAVPDKIRCQRTSRRIFRWFCLGA